MVFSVAAVILCRFASTKNLTNEKNRSTSAPVNGMVAFLLYNLKIIGTLLLFSSKKTRCVYSFDYYYLLLWYFIDYSNCGVNIGSEPHEPNGEPVRLKKIFFRVRGSGFGFASSDFLGSWRGSNPFGSRTLQKGSNHSRRTLWFAHL